MALEGPEANLRIAVYWFALIRRDLFDILMTGTTEDWINSDWVKFMEIPVEVLQDVRDTLEGKRELLDAFARLGAATYELCWPPPCIEDFFSRLICDVIRCAARIRRPRTERE